MGVRDCDSRTDCESSGDVSPIMPQRLPGSRRLFFWYLYQELITKEDAMSQRDA